MPVSPDDFKKALSCWATGVTIVTARAGDRVHGMTVSAFTEVSLEPPLVLVCADKTSNTHPLIAEGGVFAVNVLSQDQTALSDRFASKKDEQLRFVDLEYETGKTGAPLLDGTAATLDCTLVATHDAGDHVIYVGRVEWVRSTEREPLLYCRSAYRALAGSE